MCFVIDSCLIRHRQNKNMSCTLSYSCILHFLQICTNYVFSRVSWSMLIQNMFHILPIWLHRLSTQLFCTSVLYWKESKILLRFLFSVIKKSKTKKCMNSTIQQMIAMWLQWYFSSSYTRSRCYCDNLKIQFLCQFYHLYF